MTRRDRPELPHAACFRGERDMYKLPQLSCSRHERVRCGLATCTHASEMSAQTLFFSAATANALTTFLAGFAFTTTTLPNISRLPAFVAGFVFTFNIARPGIVNLPVDLTSFEATAARLASAFLQSAAFKPVAVAIAAVMLDWDMAVTFMALGAISEVCEGSGATNHKPAVSCEP